jgi:methionine-rich copper-binding protein CopC
MYDMNGSTRRKRVALLSLAAVFAVSLIAAGSAWAWAVRVTVTPRAADLCRAAPDLIGYRLVFNGMVEANGVTAPDTIRVGYQVVDRSTKRVLRSGAVTLRSSSEYQSQTPRFMATSSEAVSYHLNFYTKVAGHTLKSKKTFPDQIPSQEQLDASGLPDC